MFMKEFVRSTDRDRLGERMMFIYMYLLRLVTVNSETLNYLCKRSEGWK